MVEAMDDFLSAREGVDAALIYENEDEMDESLYWIIGNSYIRFSGARKNYRILSILILNSLKIYVSTQILLHLIFKSWYYMKLIFTIPPHYPYHVTLKGNG